MRIIQSKRHKQVYIFQPCGDNIMIVESDMPLNQNEHKGGNEKPSIVSPAILPYLCVAVIWIINNHQHYV